MRNYFFFTRDHSHWKKKKGIISWLFQFSVLWIPSLEQSSEFVFPSFWKEVLLNDGHIPYGSVFYWSLVNSLTVPSFWASFLLLGRLDLECSSCPQTQEASEFVFLQWRFSSHCPQLLLQQSTPDSPLKCDLSLVSPHPKPVCRLSSIHLNSPSGRPGQPG